MWEELKRRGLTSFFGTVGNGKDRAQTGIRKKVMSQAPDNPTVRN